jgi:hypothetical protein
MMTGPPVAIARPRVEAVIDIEIGLLHIDVDDAAAVALVPMRRPELDRILADGY